MKKVLFVCQANVGRSQAAMEMYRKAGGSADSSGTKVDAPGATLAERPGAVTIMKIMRDDYDVEMINNVRTQISEQNAKDFDKIIVMAEKETVPEWLFADERAEFWTIDDPKGQDPLTTKRIVGEVEQHMTALLEELAVVL